MFKQLLRDCSGGGQASRSRQHLTLFELLQNSIDMGAIYGQGTPQSHTADMVIAGNQKEEPQSIYINKTLVRQQKQSNQRVLPLQDDCKSRMDTQ